MDTISKQKKKYINKQEKKSRQKDHMKEIKVQHFNKNNYMNTINPVVLKMLHNKKYPPSQEKCLCIQKKKELHQATKINQKSSSLTSHNTSHLTKRPHRKEKTEKEFRTIGDHLMYEHLRYEQTPLRTSQEMEEVNNRLNEFVWERRKEIKKKYASTQRLEGLEQDKMAETGSGMFWGVNRSQQNTLSRHSYEQLPAILQNIRKRMSNEPINDLLEDHYPSKRSEILDQETKGKLESYINKEKSAKGGKEGKIKKRKLVRFSMADENMRMQREMVRQLIDQKQNQSSDIYCKVRINLNHRKIINMC